MECILEISEFLHIPLDEFALSDSKMKTAKTLEIARVCDTDPERAEMLWFSKPELLEPNVLQRMLASRYHDGKSIPDFFSKLSSEQRTSLIPAFACYVAASGEHNVFLELNTQLPKSQQREFAEYYLKILPWCGMPEWDVSKWIQSVEDADLKAKLTAEFSKLYKK